MPSIEVITIEAIAIVSLGTTYIGSHVDLYESILNFSVIFEINCINLKSLYQL